MTAPRKTTNRTKAAPRGLTVEQAAVVVDRHPMTIHRVIANGQLKATKDGRGRGRWVIQVPDLRRVGWEVDLDRLDEPADRLGEIEKQIRAIRADVRAIRKLLED